jgi:hypothetical protein
VNSIDSWWVVIEVFMEILVDLFDGLFIGVGDADGGEGNLLAGVWVDFLEIFFEVGYLILDDD